MASMLEQFMAVENNVAALFRELLDPIRSEAEKQALYLERRPMIEQTKTVLGAIKNCDDAAARGKAEELLLKIEQNLTNFAKANLQIGQPTENGASVINVDTITNVRAGDAQGFATGAVATTEGLTVESLSLGMDTLATVPKYQDVRHNYMLVNDKDQIVYKAQCTQNEFLTMLNEKFADRPIPFKIYKVEPVTVTAVTKTVYTVQ